MRLDAEQVEKIIAWLSNAHRRPGMYVGSGDPIHLINYARGFADAFRVLNILDQLKFWEFYEEIAAAHHWVITDNANPEAIMRKAGFSDAKIVDRFMQVEIETWRRVHQYLLAQEAASKPDANADEETLNP